MVKREVFLRGRSLWAAATMVALASCSHSPTAPTVTPLVPVSLASVTPASPIRGETAQLLRIAGLGFRPGLALTIMDPGGQSITIPTGDIQNLLPTSFDAPVFLRQAGRYSIVIRQQDGEMSGAFGLDVRNDPLTTPQIETVSPSQTLVDTVNQPVALIGVNFDESLIVHIVGPDNVLMVKDNVDFTLDGRELIQFTMIFDKIGTYTFSLWKGSVQVSNSSDVRVH